LLVDKPDPARDRKLAEHIMKIHNNKRKKKYHVEENIIKTQFNIDQYNQYLSLAEKYNKLC
jgi:DNA replicative helicase MCM subunit Mcm2 (Cdc46/Mcm family)